MRYTEKDIPKLKKMKKIYLENLRNMPDTMYVLGEDGIVRAKDIPPILENAKHLED